MRRLNNYTHKITDQHQNFAHKLITLHEDKYPQSKVPKYSYEEIKKRIQCPSCHSLVTFTKGNYCYRSECGETEKVEVVIIRSANEYRLLLFPEEIITTGRIFDWCGGKISKQRIKRVLIKKYRLVNKYRFSYYELIPLVSSILA